MNFTTTLISVALLIVMAVPGYALKKAKLLGENAAAPLVAVLMYVAQPILIIASFFRKSYEPRLLANMGWVLLFTTLFLFIGYGIARLIFSRRRDENGLTMSARACIAGSTLSNCSFMGIPVLQALFPDNPEPIIYSAVFNIPFQIFCWTIAVYTVSGERRHISLKNALLNPPTLALVVALPVFFAGFTVPDEIMSTLDFLGNMTTPLSMIVMGIRLAEMSPKELFGAGEVYVACALRLVVIPLAAFGILLLVERLLPIDTLVVASMYVMTAMPTAASTMLFAERFGGDTRTAVKCMLLSSILCVVTIPLLLLLL